MNTFNFWTWTLDETHWGRASTANKTVAAFGWGIMLFFWWVASPLLIMRCHWPAWRSTEKSWFWMSFVLAFMIISAVQHTYLWGYEYQFQAEDPSLIFAKKEMRGFSITLYVMIGILSAKILIADTVAEYARSKPIRRSPFYAYVFVLLLNIVPYNLVDIVTGVRCWALHATVFTANARLFLALMAFTSFTVLLYLTTRVLVTRCFSYAMVPVVLFPIHLLCDTCKFVLHACHYTSPRPVR